jgi:hypothetical protein
MIDFATMEEIKLISIIIIYPLIYISGTTPSMPYKNKKICYYTKLDEEGQIILLDYHLTETLICSFHKDSQVILDIGNTPNARNT